MTTSAFLGLEGLNNIEDTVVKKIYEKNNEVELVETMIANCITNFERNKLRSKKTKLNEDLQKYLTAMEKRISYMVCKCLHNLEREKVDSLLDQDRLNEVGNIYILLSRWGKFNNIYKMIPPQLLCVGINAGILEDLLFVLRRPRYIGLKQKHLHSEKEIVDTLNSYFTKRMSGDNTVELSFLNYLFKTQVYDDIVNFIRQAITSQFIVRRIGIKQTKETGEFMYYAYNGLYDRIPYDKRVVRAVDGDYLVNEDNYRYCVHFMNKDNALAVWEGKSTIVARSLNRRSQTGSICVVKKSIVTTPVIMLGYENYKIHKDCSEVKESLNFGLNERSKKNYNGGLIIDLKRLHDKYAEEEIEDGIQINELNIVLIHYDIPNSCIIKYVADQEVEDMWGP